MSSIEKFTIGLSVLEDLKARMNHPDNKELLKYLGTAQNWFSDYKIALLEEKYTALQDCDETQRIPLLQDIFALYDVKLKTNNNGIHSIADLAPFCLDIWITTGRLWVTYPDGKKETWLGIRSIIKRLTELLELK